MSRHGLTRHGAQHSGFSIPARPALPQPAPESTLCGSVLPTTRSIPHAGSNYRRAKAKAHFRRAPAKPLKQPPCGLHSFGESKPRYGCRGTISSPQQLPAWLHKLRASCAIVPTGNASSRTRRRRCAHARDRVQNCAPQPPEPCAIPAHPPHRFRQPRQAQHTAPPASSRSALAHPPQP